jgi:uncharacterized protein (DUF1330 family)
MPVYVVVQATIHDQKRFESYAVGSRETMAGAGGKTIARSTVEVLSGQAKHPWGAVLEFPSRQAALDWYHSPAYQQLIPLRDKTSVQDFLIYDGFQAAPPKTQ